MELEENARASAVTSLRTQVFDHLDEIAESGILDQVIADLGNKLTDANSHNAIVGLVAASVHDRNARDSEIKAKFDSLLTRLNTFEGMFADIENTGIGSGNTFDFKGLSIAAFTDVAATDDAYFANVYNHDAA